MRVAQFKADRKWMGPDYLWDVHVNWWPRFFPLYEKDYLLDGGSRTYKFGPIMVEFLIEHKDSWKLK